MAEAKPKKVTLPRRLPNGAETAADDPPLLDADAAPIPDDFALHLPATSGEEEARKRLELEPSALAFLKMRTLRSVWSGGEKVWSRPKRTLRTG